MEPRGRNRRLLCLLTGYSLPVCVAFSFPGSHVINIKQNANFHLYPYNLISLTRLLCKFPFLPKGHSNLLQFVYCSHAFTPIHSRSVEYLLFCSQQRILRPALRNTQGWSESVLLADQIRHVFFSAARLLSIDRENFPQHGSYVLSYKHL